MAVFQLLAAYRDSVEINRNQTRGILRMQLHFRTLIILGVAAVLGGSLGFAATTGAQEFCDKDVCSLDDGNCFNSGLNYRCREIADGDGCSNQECPVS